MNKCIFCEGTGYVGAGTTKQHLPIELRPIGLATCPNCYGSGENPELTLEVINAMAQAFIEWNNG